MARNPNWTRDELILALDLFFHADRKQLDANHPNVIQLSKLLNQLPIHEAGTRNTDFRNPQGVSMKLGNFLSIDPQYSGKGLQSGSKLDQEVWNEFASDPEKLKRTATSIDKSVNWVAETRAEYTTISEDDEFPEGKILTRLHLSKERNHKAVEQKKRKVLQETETLECEACGFDFFKVYGQLGYGFAECHHTVPVSELTASHKTRISELAILCANCHRMIHKSRPMLAVQGLRAIIESHRT